LGQGDIVMPAYTEVAIIERCRPKNENKALDTADLTTPATA
jgi:hypothetical protein